MENTEKRPIMKYVGKTILTLILLGIIAFVAYSIGFFVAAFNGIAYSVVVALIAVALAFLVAIRTKSD
jgi:membrane protein YdbS with pleckstrin-like domain